MASKECGERVIPNANFDRISNLPDEIISQILSLLPTKSAVGTSILSSRWKYLWTSITSLHFESPALNHNEDRGFPSFVDKVFRSCGSPNIHKFRMYARYNSIDDSRVEAWMDEVIKRNVREVDVNVTHLPLSIFNCTTLTVLTLVVPYSTAQNICSQDLRLPCLKGLHFSPACHNSRVIEKVVGCSPVLEDLSVEGSFEFDHKGRIFTVDAPTLKSLRLQLWGIGDRGIYVKTPNLEFLYLSGNFVKYKIKGDFSSLIKANVHIEDIDLRCCRYNPLQLVKKGLLPYGFTLPKFDNLKCLEVITCHHLFWVMLPKLIRNSPSLEVLSIKQHGDEMPQDEYTWVGPKLVPKCLRFHLSTIKLEGFNGRKHELELLRYLLGNAKMLQKLIINCRGLKCVEMMEFSDQLLKISKASRCKIQFEGDLF